MRCLLSNCAPPSPLYFKIVHTTSMRTEGDASSHEDRIKPLLGFCSLSARRPPNVLLWDKASPSAGCLGG